MAAPAHHVTRLSPPLKPAGRTTVFLGKRKLTYFGGCDYYRLSSHPDVIQAARCALETSGLTVAASRITTGNHPLYEKLEKALARFFAADSALLFSNGYSANIGVCQALAGSVTHALLDERSHSSLKDAARFLQCRVIEFRHRNPHDLGRQINRCGSPGALLLMTDGMFAHDGSVAPLQAYREKLPKTARLLVDDAHGAAVVGARGRGSLEEEGLARRPEVIQTIALGKAFGAYGGAVLCASALRQKIIRRSRLFQGNTPLPLPLAAAALQSLACLRQDLSHTRRLRANTARLRSALAQAGIATPQTPGPIVPIVPANSRMAARLKKRLLEAGIFPSYLHYGDGPGYFRFAISSEHEPSQLEALACALARS